MATTKKGAQKKTAPSKNRSTKIKISPATETTRIVIEVVIRNEFQQAENFSKNIKAFEALEAMPDEGRKFTYSFTKNKITILRLLVGSKLISMPADSGSFSVIVNDFDTPQQVVVMVFAVENFPAGSGSFTLTCEGTTLINDIEIPFSKGQGSISQPVNLPV